MQATAAIDLYWIPLGVGGHSVRFNGRVFAAIEAARRQRQRQRQRQRCDLYHVAIVMRAFLQAVAKEMR
jgi:hypothetical protein